MLERRQLDAALSAAGLDASAMAETHPALFSLTALALPAAALAATRDLVAALDAVAALPAWQAKVLAWAPAIAQWPQAAQGVFFGYDVHLTVDGPKLIEINTNAGGALLNALLLKAHGRQAEAAALEAAIVAMFRAEWAAARGDVPLTRIAIVDEQPASQYLAPEFQLFKQLFEAHGIAAVVADPAELVRAGDALCHAGQPVDLIYNRLTDFALAAPAHAHLAAVYQAGGVVVTPHPRAHALLADKRNLMLLSDEASLIELGVPENLRRIILAGVPRTVAVEAGPGDPDWAERFWAERKRWFFKPAAGFGSRATYRGDKLTKRVFEEILQGGYIAQEIVPPSEHPITVGAETQSFKADLRAYAYQGQVQLFAARLYQGQTTNFRTPGGGFAPVFPV